RRRPVRPASRRPLPEGLRSARPQQADLLPPKRSFSSADPQGSRRPDGSLRRAMKNLREGIRKPAKSGKGKDRLIPDSTGYLRDSATLTASDRRFRRG